MAERSAKQLGLSKADLPNSIIEVIATLTKSGFEAFIVGGGVRDTLLGLNPKDFDAVTDAKPHEIKDIFGKRCRIIGRRFQLAHVYSGRDMIEVATFRAPPTGSENTTSDGMIVRDNVWGNIHQDFERRDFSINAMYYEPLKGVVHDFCNALDDIKNKTLRLLGNAPTRIEEDPVRLLRALRFKAKLGFKFDKALAEQFTDNNWSLLDQVSPHRLYDESQKMFTGGYLVPLLPLLFEYGAIKHLIIYPPSQPTALVKQVAINTDKRIAMGKSINPAFFYAALLWDNYLYQLAKFKKKNMPFHDAQMLAASKVIDRQRIKTAIPKFAEQFIRDIWVMQPKLANPRVKQITQLAEHSRFRAAFDFLLLREQCDDAANPLSEPTNGMGEWWQNYQTLSEKEKQKAIDDFAGDARRGNSPSSRNRSRGRKRNRNADKVVAEENMLVSNNGQQSGGNQSKKETPDARQEKIYSQERAQLQQLSLGNVAGKQAESKNQPSPLFTVNADKLAKQVPKQLEVDAQLAVINKGSESTDYTQKAAVNTKPKKSKPDNKAGHTKDIKSQYAEQSKLLPSLALGSETPIPSKRRRRQPSQTLTQVERAQLQVDASNGSALESVDTVSDSIAENNANIDVAANKSQAITPSESNGSSKATEAVKTVDIATDFVNKDVALKRERVPHVRRRREPSSTQTIKERLDS